MVKSPSRLDKIFKWLILCSEAGLWGFMIFLLTINSHIHLAHIPFLFFSDFSIVMDNQQHNSITYYNKNEPLKVKFILSNDWSNPIDAKFRITKNNCVRVNYSCFDLVDSKCVPYPDSTNEFIFSQLTQTQYITVKGSFANCSNVVNICLYVQEPKFPKNDKNKCVTFTPSGLKK